MPNCTGCGHRSHSYRASCKSDGHAGVSRIIFCSCCGSCHSTIGTSNWRNGHSCTRKGFFCIRFHHNCTDWVHGGGTFNLALRFVNFMQGGSGSRQRSGLGHYSGLAVRHILRRLFLFQRGHPHCTHQYAFARWFCGIRGRLFFRRKRHIGAITHWIVCV